ncbi:unnamed protein product [Adineta steineri]|uniref:HD/PDEase domain-containing protein n=1 Tax=Adineta steineri TaxID=433720 RepID=A0A814KL61_9BILA|nr:unnamed protein product [Adineta steineri]CAF1053100.1 unnamed protein product [Adineta steineri]CAF1120354.1 unnamed protein product [Adineta steineri]
MIHELDISYVERDLNALLNRIGHQRAKNPVDIASIVVPSTKLTNAASKHAKDLLDDAIFNHSIRIYYISQMLRKDHFQRWKVNDETLYVAALMHDIALSDSIQLNSQVSFEFQGGLIGHDLVLANGGSEVVANQVFEAICKHEGMPHKGHQSVLDACLEFSTTLDVLGQVPETLWAQKQIDDLAAMLPRLGFSNRFAECMEREVKLKPTCFASTYITPTVLGWIRNNKIYSKHD